MHRIKNLILVFILIGCVQHAQDEVNGNRDWKHYQGGPGRNQYSKLEQINLDNVHKLEMAWMYRTGDADTSRNTQIQCNPLIIDGVLYGTSPVLECFALDAGTGKELWTFTPPIDERFIYSMGVNRGLTFWKDGNEKRLFYIAGNFLY